MAGTDPIHQFVIYDIFKLFTVGGDGTEGSGTTFAFTNSALFMVLTVAVTTVFLLWATSGKRVIPNRLQLTAELLYEFVAGMVRSSAGKEGMKFMPLVFSLFTFIFVANMFGMVPYFFTVTSHIIVTFALSMMVFLTVILYGFIKNGPKFLKLFVPAGVPGYILPIVTPIEVISFLSRPISLSVRLFGNILAGHITLKVFTGFAVMMIGALGALGWFAAILPMIMAVAITGLEFLVGSVQAYVFAVLTCMYLNDAIHPSH
ncbi:ATP synthase F0 subcomplex A subunit [Devosia lucknowensis]|uniref:ATP synthase subunit a n=1 Tax=Devosia lucknowensis TaxID=1096929 RepID=A0A1Y6EBC0_9HYPH|nr:F0F1 ATP synthase subunit A [Devosia lucknowensis]SMQ59769.1 ATP synthase F0 subcomplex A subunit [Devosia lucknowensis]